MTPIIVSGRGDRSVSRYPFVMVPLSPRRVALVIVLALWPIETFGWVQSSNSHHYYFAPFVRRSSFSGHKQRQYARRLRTQSSRSVGGDLLPFFTSADSNVHKTTVDATAARVVTTTTTPTAAGAASQPQSSLSSPSAIVVNHRIAAIQPSKTVEIFSMVKDMQAAGHNVIAGLCVGEPDFDPPQVVLDAATEAILLRDTRYTAVAGTIALRQAIVADLKRRKNVIYDANKEIVVANGAKQAVYQGVLAVAGHGDAVIVPAPYWTSYPEIVTLAGATPLILETTAETGFLITPDQLRTILEQHPETKLLILCNPSNPTGGVYNKERLLKLVEVLQDFPTVAVLADEIYERLVYDTDCPSMAAMPGMWHRTLTINGFSKAYAMTGMRLGYLAAPAHLAKAVNIIQGQLTSCAGSISQAAGVAALTLVSDEEIDANVALMKGKRDFVLHELATMPHASVKVPPSGAFYVLPNISSCPRYGVDDVAFCKDLLQSQQLALVPGSGFGAPGTIRISYATSLDELKLAMDKLRTFLVEASMLSPEDATSPVND